MNRLEKVKTLNHYLLMEMPEYITECNHIPGDLDHQRRLLRSLMNLWYPRKTLKPDFLTLQDELLTEELYEKGVVSADSLPVTQRDSRISIWQGDITRLKADAIVNAANSQMLGCFIPCHGCIDNAIHSAAGLQLRAECFKIMQEQGHEEPTGSAKITGAYNLPSKYVIHTVGPIVYGNVTEENQVLLASCYHSCLTLAAKVGLRSVAFCCISTGEFHFPNKLAASIAIRTVKEYLRNNPNTPVTNVVFNVFKKIDLETYLELLHAKNDNF